MACLYHRNMLNNQKVRGLIILVNRWFYGGDRTELVEVVKQTNNAGTIESSHQYHSISFNNHILLWAIDTIAYHSYLKQREGNTGAAFQRFGAGSRAGCWLRCVRPSAAEAEGQGGLIEATGGKEM